MSRRLLSGTVAEDRERLSELAGLDLEQLLLTFAGDLALDTHHIAPVDPRQRLAEAMFWLEEHMNNLRNDLCSAQPIRDFLARGEPYTLLTEAAIVYDTLVAIGHYPATAALSVVVARLGVHALCRNSSR